ncbi:MAG: DUF3040 domain-containing protein, partial [Actinobacteria bacterium]|nr:DUF3040 domain-containing protein [Actinomycetota bacterium]
RDQGNHRVRNGGQPGVPLSEDEQRILQEIEQQLYDSDPELAREVSSTTIYRHAGRNLKWAGLGFVAGLVFMVLTVQTLPLAFAGFLAMLACAVLFERNLRKMGRAGWHQWTETMRSSGMREYFGSAGQRVRERFNKKDE